MSQLAKREGDVHTCLKRLQMIKEFDTLVCEHLLRNLILINKS